MDSASSIIIYIIFGIIPSLTWLFYYLRKDVHPESNSSVIKIFLWGCLITVPVYFAQLLATGLVDMLCQNLNLQSTNMLISTPISALSTTELGIVCLYWFIVIALSEEFFKYLIIKTRILNSSELDEPIDVMLYMVIAALGFTAVENVLYIFTPASTLSFAALINRTMLLSFIRFIGATFLHTLCSAVMGYALAVSLCKLKRRWLYTLTVLFMATVLHGLYDFSIITLEGNLKIIAPITILIILAILTSIGFDKLKELKSVCSLKELWQTKLNQKVLKARK